MTFPRHLLAALAVLFLGTAAFAEEPRVPAESSTWVPSGIGDVHEALLKTGDTIFLVLHDAVDTAAVLTYPVIDLSDAGPGLHAFSLTSGERGALRPVALSSLRAETDPFLGVALFAGRERFTGMDGASVYGLEGGAAIQLLERVDLTARYRMVGRNARNPIEEIDSEISAPLFGFKVKF